MELLAVVLIYLMSVVVFLAADSIWLTKMAPRLYRKNISHLLSDKPKIPPAVIFYLIYIFGLEVFVLKPAIEKLDFIFLLSHAAFYGLVTYATFDLTNQSVMKKWPTKLSLIDVIWGITVSTITSSIVYVLAIKFIV